MSREAASSSRPALGRLEDFPDRSATPVSYHTGGREVALIVVRHGAQLRAYRDLCPHVFLPLTQRGRRVLSADGLRLRCTNHGAEFAVTDGRSLGGPAGACGLTPAALEIGPDGSVQVTDRPDTTSD
jgi:nitrite reductase/ring-hydroxylating ferredoxin subunit